MAHWHAVPLEELGADGRAVVEVAGREIALFRIGDRVHAFDDACPHAGNPLSEGEVAGSTLTCVYHLWKFDLETGACLSGDEPARRYETEVRDEAVWIDVR